MFNIPPHTLSTRPGFDFGAQRLAGLARASRDGSAQALCDRLRAGLAACQGDSVQFDGVALVAVRAEK